MLKNLDKFTFFQPAVMKTYIYIYIYIYIDNYTVLMCYQQDVMKVGLGTTSRYGGLYNDNETLQHRRVVYIRRVKVTSKRLNFK